MKSTAKSTEPVITSAGGAAPAIEGPIDDALLARMTFGDRKLEDEVLDLFERQAGMLLQRMDEAAPALLGALAHTLCGSATGIGASRVACAALQLEHIASGRRRGDIGAARARLCAEVAAVRTAIARRQHSR